MISETKSLKLVRILVFLQNVDDGLLEVELFGESAYRAQGSAAPLLYQSLIDSGRMKLSR